MPTPPYPLVNGFRFDWSSAVVKFGGALFYGVKSITYKHSVDPGKVRGNRAQVVGVTRGEYNAEGSVELYKSEYDELTTALAMKGRGFFGQFFETSVSYSEAPDMPVITDLLHGCRLISAENSHSEGSDALVVRCDLLIMSIAENGKSPLDPKMQLF